MNKAGIENGETSYAKYINVFEALQGTSYDRYEEELISYDRLHECVLDTFPKMKTFSKAVNNRFYNGYAKSFCRDLSILCSKDLLDCVTESRATFTDSFKLMKMITKAESKSPICTRSWASSMSIENCHSAPSSLQRSNNSPSSHYALGNQVADLMALNSEESPLVIFECKSSLSAESKKGMLQLISHGLSLRDKKRVKHEIKLVLVTPLNWYSASLPPYTDEPERRLDVTFEDYKVFVLVDQGCFLHRSCYTAFLRNLRRHFELVKSAE